MRSTRIPCEIEWYRAVGIFALRLYTGNVETQGVFDVTGLKECPQGLDVMQLPTDQSIAIMNHHFRDWSRILTGNSKKSAWVKQKTGGTKMSQYNHTAIEKKWRENWEKHPINVNDGKKEKYYCLDVPISVRKWSARWSLERLRYFRCMEPLSAAARQIRDPSDGLGRIWSAGRELRDQDGRTPGYLDRVQH